MIPEHVLSTELRQALFYTPDSYDPSPIVDWELGGIALNDPSVGLQYQVWKCYLHIDGVLEESNVWIGPEAGPFEVFYAGGDITEISFCFDQNMNPFLAYVEDSVAKFYWFDTVVSDYVVTELPVGSRSPKCCIDDKRDVHTSTSDIILTYMRTDKLYYREQRDRYLIEYELADGYPGLDVLIVGMNKVNRLQWLLGTQDYPSPTINYRVATGSRNRITVGGDRRRLVKVSYG
jgi:hypothetical protein